VTADLNVSPPQLQGLAINLEHSIIGALSSVEKTFKLFTGLLEVKLVAHKHVLELGFELG
jgi:hypothetical protein